MTFGVPFDLGDEKGVCLRLSAGSIQQVVIPPTKIRTTRGGRYFCLEMMSLVLFIFLNKFWVLLSLCCCVGFYLIVVSRGLLFFVAHRLSCSAAYGILPDQGLNPCLLHWQVDSLPLSHERSLVLERWSLKSCEICRWSGLIGS